MPQNFFGLIEVKKFAILVFEFLSEGRPRPE